MSKTFTSRPAAVRGRGRGRGQGTQTTTRDPGPRERVDMSVRGQHTGPRNPEIRPTVGRGEGMASQSQTGDTGQPSQAQRMSHTGAYTMITPNEKKRQEVMEMARKESEDYNSYRQQKTPASFNIVGTVGGGQMTESESRRKTVQESPTKLQRIQKLQQNKLTVKQREQEELDRKKMEQRKKSEINARKGRTDQQKWDDDRRLTNEAHFRKLDLETKAKIAKTGKTGSVNKTGTASPEKEVSPAPVHPEASTSRQADNIPYTDSNLVGACGTYTVTLSPEQDKRVTSLAVVFPQYSRNELTEILNQVGFSVDQAIELLQD